VRTKDYNWFRFPILLNSEEEKNKLVKLWKENKIIFWTSWSWINIAPVWTDLEKAQYKIWSCPVAEDISKRILTLPNHKLITKKDMDRVVDLLNNL
jgi:dTDP-4-amino-4,6-dideoxygalactose transaminase